MRRLLWALAFSFFGLVAFIAALVGLSYVAEIVRAVKDFGWAYFKEQMAVWTFKTYFSIIVPNIISVGCFWMMCKAEKKVSNYGK